MHYIIDAYNLLFRRLGWEGELRVLRERLVEQVNEKVDLLGWEVTLVFDAVSQFGAASRSRHDALDIVFTGEGISADDHIIRSVERLSNPGSYTVVTSDKHLAWSVRNHGAKTETVEAFEGRLNKSYRKKLWKRNNAPLPKLRTKPEESTAPPEPKERIPPPSDSLGLSLCYDWYLQTFEENSE